jgi:hypothetical protein
MDLKDATLVLLSEPAGHTLRAADWRTVRGS